MGQIFKNINETSQSMDKFIQSKETTLKVGFAEDQLFYPLMNHLSNTKIKMQEIIHSEIIAKIKNHQLDAGVTFLPVEDRELTSQFIFDDEVVAVVATKSKLAQLTQISMNQVAQTPISTMSSKFHFRKLLDQFFQDKLILPNYQYELSSVGSCINIIQNDANSVALVPKSVLTSKQCTNVKMLPIVDQMLSIQMGLVYLKETQSTPPLTNLANQLISQFNQ
ncbi:LysR family transcriptional regulator substrate-binding protein [Nicoliella lavandulae]|uniref:LysR family transcriptional regulator substrate-binding protein n=1 Tax=Nicoliella lavandulae TaxID=3082954 RepID=A0ABU8SMB3_9LACO